MSIGEFLTELPMDKFKMLLGLGVAAIGCIPLLVGLGILATTGDTSTAMIVIGAGGSLITAGLTLIAVDKATAADHKAQVNGEAIMQTLETMKQIRICSRPEDEAACIYERTVDVPVKQ